MKMTNQTNLASRPAAMVLALSLVGALSVPVLMLPQAQAAPPVLPCTEGNNNGCTELSPTPPEDTVNVPPNIVLMLDDSGSMDYDYMPDDLANTSLYGTRNSTINGIYYNPATVYTPPPRADGTLYPDSPGLLNAYFEGFMDDTPRDVTDYTASKAADNNKQFRFWENLATTEVTTTDHDYGPAVWGGGSPGSPGSPESCPNNYHKDPNNSNQCIRSPVSPTTTPAKWVCNSGDVSYKSGGVQMCHHYVWEEGRQVDYPYAATYVPASTNCPNPSTLGAGGKCYFAPVPVIPATPPTPPTPDYMWVCNSGSPDPANSPPPPAKPPRCTSKSNSRRYIHAFTYVVGAATQRNQHFVIPRTPDAPAAGWCSVLQTAWQKNNCVDADDTSGTAAPLKNEDGTPALAQDGTALNAGQNVANWFSYYRTRMLMAKSSLMTAFTKVGPNYRFGFASINANGVSSIPTTPTPYGFDDSTSGGGSSNNKLAVVQPFGVGTSGCPNLPGATATCTEKSQKDKFWSWIAKETADGNTPLRKALQGVGEYYKTAQPWSAMSSDPGYSSNPNAQFSCRASYAILTTDGFWNGASPNVGNVDSSGSGPYPVPPGAINGYTPKAPFSDNQSDTLADVAMYYWKTDLSSMPNQVASTTADPASWQHMTTFTVGLGVDPTGIQPAGTTFQQILAWSQGGTPISGFSWPPPSSNDINNIADLAHAAINGHGEFFSAKSPDDLANAFGKITSDIGARQPVTPAAGVNASVLSLGALSFSTGYNTKDWSGMLEGVTLKADATIDQALWLDGRDPKNALMTSQIDAAYHSNTASAWGTRNVYTGAYKVSAGGVFTPFQFKASSKSSLDATETAGLQSPALAGGNDTLDNRINYLLGDSTYEGGIYRARTSILGAILRSAPVYILGATSNYYDRWPSFGGIPAPEVAGGAQKYDAFVTQQSTQKGMVYVGANDGMLHAFHAPVPKCTGTVGSDGNCSAYSFATGATPGAEAWAYVPRAVYANLGNLTTATNFSFLPTVDGTPTKRDVFFSDAKWHTLLVGGVGLGGRGVYALDITDPTSFTASSVKWEFDSDMSALATGCVTNDGTACRASDLGYTVSQPNIGRLSNGQWVVLVPNGYFPDCTTPDVPTGNNAAQCTAIASQAPKTSSGKPYSALFVLNAETGKMIAELKTPTTISGVTSFGLATPVLGDYNNDQIDDVAFAGDVQGNLWRFDLSGTAASSWTVTLVYKAPVQGAQPITTMPHLFPDPTTNRFMVTFGTGKFLGLGDNSNTVVQALYGVRDDGSTHSTDLVQQFLHETKVSTTLPNGDPNTSPIAGASLRCVTGGANDTCDPSGSVPPTPTNAVPASKGGWFINLYTTTSDGTRNDAGERVVVSPGAIFASNTVVFETLITGAQSSDPCSPSTVGSIMALNAITGSPAGVSSLGGWPIVGGRISNARTSGSLPIVSALGGGQAYLPGTALDALQKNPLSIDAPIWRRRSWSEIQQN